MGHRVRDRPELQQGVGGVRPGRPGRVAGQGARASSNWRRAAARRDVERGLIDALADPLPRRPDDLDAGHARYADAMVDARRGSTRTTSTSQALAADALMNVSAWALWDTRTGEPAPGSRVVEAKRILDDALATDAGRRHPGVLHLYMHAMEMSAHPEVALPAANLLRGLVPDAGHLQHMPSHIDVLCGDYRSSVESQYRCGAGGPAVRRARGAAQLLLAVPGARPALHRVLGDVRGPVRDGDRRRPTNSPRS